ncbi:GNAT family N-acetyltransferase [Paludibaculum fermentans]|uniref:GNAT family N-acetyltransferase n=1 Tax=Paludibaculum fermentans TaxID=1473598 RepID=UPI003EBC6328
METERLQLLPWRAGDEWLLEPLATDPLVMRYITGGAPMTAEQIHGFVDRQVALYAELGLCRWRLELKETRETIGFAGVGRLTGMEELEIGWWLAPVHWGRGYATEAGQAALRDAFARCGLASVISITRPENEASQRVMQRIGLRNQGRRVHAGLEHVVYTTTREEWLGANSDGSGSGG